jgi:AraC family transcriptional activator of tynA and feaB
VATTTGHVGPFRGPAATATPHVQGRTERVAGWRDLLREHFVALDVHADAAGPFDGAVRSSLVGHLAVASVASTEQDCLRTPGLARGDPDAYLQVGLVARGQAVVRQDGREALLSPGAYTIYETGRPFAWRFRGPWELLVFTWPRELVGLDEETSRAATARALGGDRLGGIVGRTLADVVASPPRLSPDGGRRLATELADLVGTVAGEALRPVPGGRSAAELRARVDAYVAEHLEDPDLTPETIARAHFVSTRQLHRAFAEASTTVGRLVRQRRLEYGRRELGDSRLGALSVTDIALRCGFGDLATFSRAFKDAFHEPPSTFRRRHTRRPPRRGANGLLSTEHPCPLAPSPCRVPTTAPSSPASSTPTPTATARPSSSTPTTTATTTPPRSTRTTTAPTNPSPPTPTASDPRGLRGGRRRRSAGPRACP